MKVALITTVRHNVGDDFVRDGIVYLLGKVVGPIQQLLIHKHLPATVRQEWSWLNSRAVRWFSNRFSGLDEQMLSRFVDRFPFVESTDKILGSDMVVQCGAPVYWKHDGNDCSKNEWYHPLIEKRWARVSDRVRLLNIGAGSCQTYESDGSEFEGANCTLEYIRDFHSKCVLTTVRDRLSEKILSIAGLDAPVLPCPSIFARRLHGLEPGFGSYVVLNYMPLGGHYKFENRIDHDRWGETFTKVARSLAKSERCVLVCHNREELTEATRRFPDFERFYSTDYREYLRVYSEASCGVLNRVHGAFALASFGIPSLVIGNDSRARMTEMIGMPSMHVADATPDAILTDLSALRREALSRRTLLDQMVAKTEEKYLSLLESSLKGNGGPGKERVKL